MSLELALQENTAAVNALASLLAKVGLSIGNPLVTTGEVKAEKVKEVVAEKKAEAAVTDSAATVTTAATSDAPVKKVESSEVKVLSADERTSLVKEAIGKVGRDKVVALLTEFGAKKASEISEAGLPAFDAKLSALVA
jgi:hypothetical protein